MLASRGGDLKQGDVVFREVELIVEGYMGRNRLGDLPLCSHFALTVKDRKGSKGTDIVWFVG